MITADAMRTAVLAYLQSEDFERLLVAYRAAPPYRIDMVMTAFEAIKHGVRQRLDECLEYGKFDS